MGNGAPGGVRPQDYQVPQNVLDLLPCEQALRYRVCPIAITEAPNGMRLIIVACPDPSDLPLIDQLQQFTGCRVQPMLASEEDVLLGIAAHYQEGAAKAEELLPKAEPLPRTPDQQAEIQQESALVQAADTPTARSTLERIFRRAVAERSTDIHLEPHEQTVIVRFRIDGILGDHMSYEKSLHPAVISRIKILSNLDISQNRLPQDGRFDVQVGKRIFDIRVSILPTMAGESSVMRLLPKGHLALNFDELGFSEQGRANLESLIHRPYGMVLLTGPTGSGKTTTLYASLMTIDCVGKKVVTIEDPVEYQFERVAQIQVNPKIGLTFATGLRSILRHDPDVIMVGEIRDLETLDMAIHSALTGHMVLSTLHCNDASAAPARMVDMGAEPFLVASSVSGLVAQRLIRRICPECKIPAKISNALREQLELPNDEAIYYHGAGCDQCRGTGYFGRVSVFEVVPMHDEIQQAVIRNASAQEVRHIVRSMGIPSLRDDGLDKARAGLTTLEEVIRAVYAEVT